MSPRLSLPRVRYAFEPSYNNRPGFHDVQYEMIFMSDRDLVKNDAVRSALLQYTNDVYFMEAFTADYIHRLVDFVEHAGKDANSKGLNDSCTDVGSESFNSESDSSSIGKCYYLNGTWSYDNIRCV